MTELEGVWIAYRKTYSDDPDAAPDRREISVWPDETSARRHAMTNRLSDAELIPWGEVVVW